MTVLDTVDVGGLTYHVRIPEAAALTPVLDVREAAWELWQRRKAGEATQRDMLEAASDQALTAACIEVAAGVDDGHELMIRAAYESDLPYNETRLAKACQHACGVGGTSRDLGKAAAALMSADDR